MGRGSGGASPRVGASTVCGKGDCVSNFDTATSLPATIGTATSQGAVAWHRISRDIRQFAWRS
jgi:hypothetical protein